MDKWLPSLAVIQALFVLGMQISGPASAQVDIEGAYMEFRSAWFAVDDAKLDLISDSCKLDPRSPFQALAFISSACAAYHRNERSGSLAYLDTAEMFVGPEQVRLRSWVHRMRAKNFKKARATEKAFDEIQIAISLLRGSVFQEEFASCLIIRAEIQRKLNRHTAALISLEEAKVIAEEFQFGPAICNGLLDRGNIFYDQSRYEEAWDAYSETMRRSMDFGSDRIANKAAMNLGAVAFMTDRYEQAAHLYDSIIGSMPSRSSTFKADLLRHSGHASEKLGDVSEAMAKYAKALSWHEELNDSSGIAKTLQLRSTLKWKIGALEEAIDEREKALAMARELRWTDVETESLVQLYDWYRSVGRTEDAILALEEFQILSDSLNRSKFHTELAYAEVRFDTERKERELRLHKVELAKEREVKARRSIQRNMLLGILILVLVATVLGYRNLRQRQVLALKDKELSEQRVEKILRSQELRLVNAMMTGQEQERERIAKDLHDRLGSMLSAIKIQFNALESRVENLQFDQQEGYVKVLGMLDQAVGEVRRISHDMLSGALSRFGLERALADLRGTIHIPGTMDVELSVFGLDERLERDVEITAYRIVQELVSNTLKHAKASELSIIVTNTDEGLSIVVADNGVGFDAKSATDGIGMQNVRQRVAAYHGEVHVDSRVGRGTSISVSIPHS